MLQEIEGNKKNWVIPSNIRMHRKQGSRGCYFECDDNDVSELKDFLDEQRISWQASPMDKKAKKEKSYEKEFGGFKDPWVNRSEKKAFGEFKDPWNN